MLRAHCVFLIQSTYGSGARKKPWVGRAHGEGRLHPRSANTGLWCGRDCEWNMSDCLIFYNCMKFITKYCNIRRSLTLSFVSEFHAVMKNKTITDIWFVSEIHAFVKYKTINHIVHSPIQLVFNHSEYVYFSFPCRVSTICVFVLLDLIHFIKVNIFVFFVLSE